MQQEKVNNFSRDPRRVTPEGKTRCGKKKGSPGVDTAVPDACSRSGAKTDMPNRTTPLTREAIGFSERTSYIAR